MRVAAVNNPIAVVGAIDRLLMDVSVVLVNNSVALVEAMRARDRPGIVGRADRELSGRAQRGVVQVCLLPRTQVSGGVRGADAGRDRPAVGSVGGLVAQPWHGG